LFTRITERIDIDGVKSDCFNRHCLQERTWRFDNKNKNFTLGICANCGMSPGYRDKISLGRHGTFVKEDESHVRMVNPNEYATDGSKYTIGIAIDDGKMVAIKTESIEILTDETPNSFDCNKLSASL